MHNYLVFLLAALLEIAGCYAAWMWLRLGRSPWWLVPGGVSLLLFAIVLARADAAFAGRAFAAYGGVYIATALAWLTIVEGTLPLPSDLIGVLVCLAGAGIIVFGSR